MKQKIQQEWPKKMRPSDYVKHHYAGNGITAKTVINRIKKNILPGVQDESGHWFVLVNEDMSPALLQPQEPVLSDAANDAVNRILEQAGM